MDDFRDSESRRTSFERDWNEFYRLWRGKPKIGDRYPFLSRSHIPMTYTQLETMVPFFMDSVFNDRQFIVGEGQRPDDEDNADQIGKFVNWQFLNPIGYQEKLEDTIRATMIYGTAFQKVMYRVGSAPDLRKVDEDEEEEFTTAGGVGVFPPGHATFQADGVTRRKFYEGPDVDYVSPYDVYIDFAATSIEKMRFLIHRYRVPLSELKEQEFDEKGERILHNLDEIREGTFSEVTDVKSDRLSAQGGGRAGHGTSAAEMQENNRDDRMVDVMDYWTGPWLIRVVNESTIIYNDVNPNPDQKIPFVAFRTIRDPDFFYGLGLPEVIRSMQKTVNTILNQRLDNINYILNPMWKVRRGGAVALRQLAARPNGFIKVNDPDDVSAHVAPDVTGSAIANMRDLEQHADQATGVNSLFRGEEPSTSRFAASLGVSLQRASARRHALSVKSLQLSIIKVVGMVHSFNAAFPSQDLHFARFIGVDGGVEYPQVSSDMLRQTFVDFRPVGKASNGNPDILAQTLLQLDSQWSERPELGQNGRRVLMQEIMDTLDLPNRTKIVEPVQQPSALPGQAQGGLLGLLAAAGGQGGLLGGGAPEEVEAGPSEGAPAEIIMQPPAPAGPNRGGARTIPIPF